MAADHRDEPPHPSSAHHLESVVSRLLAENRHLLQEKEAAKLEKDSLQRELNLQRDQVESLYREVMQTEKAHEETLFELREVRRERILLTEEKIESERRYDLLVEDSASVILSTLASQSDLEERLERKNEALKFVTVRLLRKLRRTRELICEGEGGDEEMVDGDEEDEGMEAMIRPLVEEMEEIERGLRKLGTSSLSEGLKKKCFF